MKGETRVRINEMGAGKEYGKRDWDKEKWGGKGKSTEEGVKREREGKGTQRRERGEGDEKGAGN